MASNIENLLLLMGKHEKLRVDVREKLLKGGKGIFDHLVRALKSNRSSTIRRNAALILGEMGNKKAVDALIRALRDRVISVSSNAAIALGMIGDKRAVTPLIERLESSAWQVRLNAAISLGWIADPGATHSLLGLLRDHHIYVRRGAAFALGQMGDMKLRDTLIQILTDAKEPALESAVVLASLGDLSGYFYLDQPLPETSKDRSSKKSSKKAVQALRLGNLFYSSSLFPAALAEYRRALAFRERISSQAYFCILNNLGHAFRALGQPDHALVFYMLALRIRPKDKSIKENLRKAETLSDIQELVVNRIKTWMANGRPSIGEPRSEVLNYFVSLSEGLSEDILNQFIPHFSLGWKTFYGLETFRKEENHSSQLAVPIDFLIEHVPVCRSVLVSEPSFRSLYLLLLRISDSHLPTREEDLEEELVPMFHEAFLCGYLVGLLQKIWWLSHLRFSGN